MNKPHLSSASQLVLRGRLIVFQTTVFNGNCKRQFQTVKRESHEKTYYDRLPKCEGSQRRGQKRWSRTAPLCDWPFALQIHDGISQPSSFIFRFVQCCSFSNSAGSITTKRRPALPPASAHTRRPLAWITVSLSGSRKLTSTNPAKPLGSATAASPIPPVLRLTACTWSSLP